MAKLTVEKRIKITTRDLRLNLPEDEAKDLYAVLKKHFEPARYHYEDYAWGRGVPTIKRAREETCAEGWPENLWYCK